MLSRDGEVEEVQYPGLSTDSAVRNAQSCSGLFSTLEWVSGVNAVERWKGGGGSVPWVLHRQHSLQHQVLLRSVYLLVVGRDGTEVGRGGRMLSRDGEVEVLHQVHCLQVLVLLRCVFHSRRSGSGVDGGQTPTCTSLRVINEWGVSNLMS